MAYQMVLAIHIGFGILALVAVPVLLVLPKGDRRHARLGLGYVVGMTGVFLTTLLLVVLKPNPFLFAVGLFSFYLVFSGWRAARQGRGANGWLDRAAAAAMAVTGLAMVALGGWGHATDGNARMAVMAVFGLIGGLFAIEDLRGALGQTGRARIARHLGRMLGGTIATLTAVAVVNLAAWPTLVVWLGPTVLLTPLIALWSRRVMRGEGFRLFGRADGVAGSALRERGVAGSASRAE